ncbi:hypothetical protein Tco_1364960 [Tanacetum coccineum]
MAFRCSVGAAIVVFLMELLWLRWTSHGGEASWESRTSLSNCKLSGNLEGYAHLHIKSNPIVKLVIRFSEFPSLKIMDPLNW